MKEKEDIEVPESEWTKGQREFVGSTFPTPKGGVLTVVGVNSGTKSNGRHWGQKFNLTCSICSQDKELWPEGSINTLKSFLEKGTAPCGCTRTPRWTKRQYEVMIRRECSKKSFEFLGFFGEWRGKYTKIHLLDLDTGEEWKTSSVHSLLGQDVGNPYESQRRKLKGDMSRKYHDNDERILLKSEYPEGSTFKLLKGNRWEVTCSKCKGDFYSHVDGGRFKTFIGSLLRGVKSCRCSSNHIWSQDEREAEMRHLLSPDSGEFLWWKSPKGYENAHSKFVWRCHRGHVTDSTVNTIKSKSRCRYCKKEDMIARGWANGYMPDKKEKLDNLYILNFDRLYGKIGRAFDIGVRIRKGEGLSKLSGISAEDIKVCHVFSGTHEEVYWVEQVVLSRLGREGLLENRYSWNTELFLDGYEDYVRDCVNQLGILKEVLR